MNPRIHCKKTNKQKSLVQKNFRFLTSLSPILIRLQLLPTLFHSLMWAEDQYMQIPTCADIWGHHLGLLQDLCLLVNGIIFTICSLCFLQSFLLVALLLFHISFFFLFFFGQLLHHASFDLDLHMRMEDWPWSLRYPGRGRKARATVQREWVLFSTSAHCCPQSQGLGRAGSRYCLTRGSW